MISVCFKETEPGRIRLSFRSKGAVDVAALAARWGGGGHRNAAGATARGTFAPVERDRDRRRDRRHLGRP